MQLRRNTHPLFDSRLNGTHARLWNIFHTLLESFGRRNWWPGETSLEIAIGAILTQNTSWRNVEKAIESIKVHDALRVDKLYAMDNEVLAQIIRSSGCYNIKANRLKALVNVIHNEYDDNMFELNSIDMWRMREILLGIAGIGKETADSILLYALEKPVFVVDAYTKRFLINHGIYNGDNHYDAFQRFFMENLPHDVYLFNEFHALIVYLCQSYCKKTPLCAGCPLKGDLK